jgi:hypothetical protein
LCATVGGKNLPTKFYYTQQVLNGNIALSFAMFSAKMGGLVLIFSFFQVVSHADD